MNVDALEILDRDLYKISKKKYSIFMLLTKTEQTTAYAHGYTLYKRRRVKYLSIEKNKKIK
jgi:hypothetical protein